MRRSTLKARTQGVHVPCHVICKWKDKLAVVTIRDPYLPVYRTSFVSFQKELESCVCKILWFVRCHSDFCGILTFVVAKYEHALLYLLLFIFDTTVALIELIRRLLSKQSS